MIQLRDVNKKYFMGQANISVSEHIDLQIKKGELAVIVGESGAGKSTLLNIISGLEKPDSGSVKICGQEINCLNEKELSLYRKEQVGFVFQFYNLIANLTVKENVELIARMNKKSFSVEKVLKLVGLTDRMDYFPNQLSGGEQQRASIARAIVKHPKILLCDEPTGALDYETSREILKLLQRLSVKTKMTIVMVTHNRSVIPMANRVFEVGTGKIVNQWENPNPSTVEKLSW